MLVNVVLCIGIVWVLTYIKAGCQDKFYLI